MFDYQAGEKYKLTLIMVALAGLLAGVFFTVLLMPTPEAAPRRRQPPAWASNPDVTGQAADAPGQPGMEQQGQEQQGPALMATDPLQAKNLIENFLPLTWDLSAYSARTHQDQAIQLMTEECKQSYTNNIWTPQIADQIEKSGVQSQFVPKKVEPSPIHSDGSVEVIVEGQQTLAVPGKPPKTRDLKVVYLVRQLPEGLRIAGISEAGQTQ
ncbi:MAG: hypothetical protein K2X27_22195 [Candidatus Obscuribacterales bacterium]|nr:hypothetical protein [Candidatus Obscuribacterales bacterium]